MKRYWNSLPNFIITGIISLICLIGCGSGGGGGSNNQSNDTNDTTENISISGSVIPPGGVEPSSLRMVSLGDTSSITSQGSYTAKVYDDGVTIIAAIPENKEFGLMNVVATQNTPTYTNKGNPTLRKIISAYKVAENNTLVELNAKTTAVSMVFVSPYFLTNDPEMAGETLSVIENDPKVAYLTTVIESVFNEPDPLSDPALKQALIDAVESVLNTLSIQTGSAKVISTHVSPSSILRLPRTSYKTLTTSPYYADQDYITVKAEPSASGYDVSIVTQNGGSIDWIAEVMQLDSSQFNSLNDLQTKASNNRTVYQDEQINTLSELSGEAKSYFRYIDIIRLAFDFIANYAFGDAIKDQITVPSDKDGIYLIRSYSGAWGKLVDPEENSFVRTQIPNGSAMHNKSWTTNLFLGVCDTMGAFVVFDKLLPDDMNKVFMKGIEQAFKELGPVMGNSNTALSDLLRVSSHIGTAMLSELTSQFAQQATKNFFITIARIGEISVSSIIDYSGKASKLGKAADRVFQMLTLATPLETTIVVVGDLLADLTDIEKPSPPANLTATPLSSNQIDLSWSTSPEYDVVGYKIYRDEVQIGTSATLNYSDKDLLPSTKYCYIVSAYDAAGNESAKSTETCTTTQTVVTTWTKTYGGINEDYGSSVQMTTDGGYIIVGSTESYGAGGSDVYLIKTDANGNMLWEKTFGGTNNDYGYSVQQTFDSGYIITGGTESYGVGGDVYLIKTDTNGDKVWENTFGGVNRDYGYSIQQTFDGGYIITGVYGYSSNDHDVYLIKTDANGNMLWEKIFGNALDDTGRSIQQISDGGYIVIGVKDAAFSFNNGSSDYSQFITGGDVYMIKTDSTGNKIWEKTYGTWSGGDVGLSIYKTSDGGYIISGWKESYSSSSDAYLIKTDTTGNVLWEKTFGGTNEDYGDDIQQTSDGGYIIAGLTKSYGTGGSDVYLIKTDATGNNEWEKTFGGISNERGLSVRQISDDGYLIVGYTKTYGAGGGDVYLIRTDSSGNVQLQ